MKKIVLPVLFFLSAVLPVFSQDIDATITRYATNFGQEKAYLQYDKSVYAPGETIWFKAYLMEGLYPAEASKNFYVDWTDDNGNLLEHTVSPMQGATTNGQFAIPADYKGRFIHVKAYTRWMMNFDSAFVYEKDIQVLTTANAGPALVKPAVPPVLVFFPEGGDMIEGTSNKIAFKVNDQWGRPVKIKGVIRNSAGKVIDSLRVQHHGMGFFYLLPQHGESFTAKWKDDKGTEYTTPLPSSKATGVALQVTSSAGRKNFSVTVAPGWSGKPAKVTVIGTMNQFQAFKVVKDVSQGSAQGVIPTSDLPSGILTITVFDEQWKPLAERITYINNEEYKFTAEMNVQRWGLNKRARNEIEISVPDSIPANFAISVTDAAIGADSSNTIISHLLLTGDLRGQVYDPAYYFRNNEDTTSQKLDLVMLTHGWRRFNWDDVAKGKMPVIKYPRDTSYLTLSGKLYGVTPAEVRNNAHIILVLSMKKNEGNKMLFVPIEPDASFGDPNIMLFDTANIYYQLSKTVRDATVQFMESRLPAYRNKIAAKGSYYNIVGDTTGNARQFRLSDELARAMRETEGKLLENVTVQTKAKTPLQVMDEKYTSGLFTGGDGYQFDIVNDKFGTNALSVFTYLQAKIPGLNINVATAEPQIQWRGGTPLFFLDETPVNANFVSSISMNDVAYIKVFRPPFYGAAGGSAGAIAVYTRRGADVKATPGKGLASSTIVGYSPIRQFYSPNYSSFAAANEKKDLRTTLYWNPQVITTQLKNKTVVSFYNNDVSKAFRVVIEGMTKDGRLVHLEQIME